MKVLTAIGLVVFGAFPIPANMMATEADARLIAATKQADRAAVVALLQTGADANASTSDGATALHWAVLQDDLELTKILVTAKASVDLPNRFGIVPLRVACTNGNTAIVSLLLDAGADANASTADGETALMVAARTGNPEAVRTLLNHGAKVNQSEKLHGQTGLMWSAAEGHVATVQVLLAAGADVNARSQGGFTAFLFAVRQGKIEVVRTLLESGADPNQALLGSSSQGGQRRPRPGATALGLAVTNAHYELAALLLEAGADPNAMWQGRNALHTLTWVRKPGAGSNNPSPPGSGTMNSLQFVREMVRHGADLNARMTARSSGVRTVFNMLGATPILLAARTADAELMRLLAELGADPLLTNSDQTTLLMAAAGVGVQAPMEDPGTPSEVLEAIKVALDLGSDVNAVDDRGETAMHGIAYKHVAGAVPLLVTAGADIKTWNQKNQLGWTPLRIATGVHRGMNLRSSPETAEALLKVMIAHGVSTFVEPETNISGSTN